jgi:hypothetical protein
LAASTTVIASSATSWSVGFAELIGRTIGPAPSRVKRAWMPLPVRWI